CRIRWRMACTSDGYPAMYSSILFGFARAASMLTPPRLRLRCRQANVSHETVSDMGKMRARQASAQIRKQARDRSEAGKFLTALRRQAATFQVRGAASRPEPDASE